jgi:hypothetical protein
VQGHIHDLRPKSAGLKQIIDWLDEKEKSEIIVRPCMKEFTSWDNKTL